MLTTIYFVRHAQPDHSWRDDRTRPLSDEGKRDSAEVTRVLLDKGITRIYSSPYTRTRHTVRGLSAALKLPVRLVEDFRERNAGSWQGDNFLQFIEKQWEDFHYHIQDGECLADVQRRNISALNAVLSENAGKTAAIATHGTALSTIINYYRPEFGFRDFMRIIDYMPYVLKMTFDENGRLCDMEDVLVIEKEFKK